MSEAPELVDFDEFEGLSLRDVALFITLAPEGSEEENRAIDAIRKRAPGIGHNRPPLEETIAEELGPWRAQRDQLVKTAASVAILDDESAKKVSDLIIQMKDAEALIKDARTKRKRPYLEGGRYIDAQFNPVEQAIAVAREAAQRALTVYDDRRKAETAAAERKAREEQAQREREAAAARQKAEEAAAAGKTSVADNLAALRAEEEAEKAAQRARVIRPEPIRSTLGQVMRRREIKIDLLVGKTAKDDGLRLLIGWVLKATGGRSAMIEPAMTFLRRHLTALGVDAVEKGIEVPGVKISVVDGQANVRR